MQNAKIRKNIALQKKKKLYIFFQGIEKKLYFFDTGDIKKNLRKTTSKQEHNIYIICKFD